MLDSTAAAQYRVYRRGVAVCHEVSAAAATNVGLRIRPGVKNVDKCDGTLHLLNPEILMCMRWLLAGKAELEGASFCRAQLEQYILAVCT